LGFTNVLSNTSPLAVLQGLYPEGNLVLLNSYLFHLKTRNLSPNTIKAAEDFLRPFTTTREPLTASRHEIEDFLTELFERCKPSTVWTYWRHLKGFYKFLEQEGDIDVNPMANIPRPIVPQTEVRVLNQNEVQQLLSTCHGRSREEKRDYAILAVMLDSGIRLSEVAGLTLDDIGQDGTLRIYGKGRKWRTVALGVESSTALNRWLRLRGNTPGAVWLGRKGQLTNYGIRRLVKHRGMQIGVELHPHMLRHTFVDNWLRNGGAEVDLARLCGWTSTRMAEQYARHQANERAVTAHKRIAPLDAIARRMNKSF
jgi:site-specific recombinase XerD